MNNRGRIEEGKEAREALKSEREGARPKKDEDGYRDEHEHGRKDA